MRVDRAVGVNSVEGTRLRPAPKGRGRRRKVVTLLDVLIVAAVLAVAGYVGYRMNSVLVYQWDWSSIPGYFMRRDPKTGDWVANLLLKGLATTVRIALLGMLIATVLGVLLAFARTSRRLLLRLVGWAYVGFIRNIPAVPFLFLFYFFISTQLIPIFGIDRFLNQASPATRSVLQVLFGEIALIPNFASGVIALSLMMAAYICEIVRAGIESIPKGQYEAGCTVGLGFLVQHHDVQAHAPEVVLYLRLLRVATTSEDPRDVAMNEA